MRLSKPEQILFLLDSDYDWELLKVDLDYMEKLIQEHPCVKQLTMRQLKIALLGASY